ncbi:MAG TPA: adenylate/guanylate cyclase domain-containing protein [Bacteroidia bacterium]|nr:adenylate/guanylate cyclase domain-containing protein [Bacteroidia bacterium]
MIRKAHINSISGESIKGKRGFKLFFVLFSVLISVTSFASDQLDSLKKVLSSTHGDSSRADVLIQMSIETIGSDLKASEEYANQALNAASRTRYYKGMAAAYRYLGLSQYQQSQYKEAVSNWLLGVAMYDSVGDKSNIARLYSNLGAVYESQSRDDKALEYNIKSLKIAEQINDSVRQMAALTNIGVIYGKNRVQFDKALSYDERAIDYARKLGDAYVEGTVATNMGEIYFKQGKDSLAKVEFLSAAKVFGEGGIEESMPYPLQYIGKVYARAQDYASAESYQKKALEIAERLDLKRDVALVLIGLAETSLKKGDFQTALEYYKRAKDLSVEIGVKEELKDSYRGLSQTYVALKDFKNAYIYQNLLTSLKDTLYNIEFDQKMSGQLFDYELEKKQSQISLLNKDKEIAEQLAQRQRFAKNASLAGLGLVVIILFIIFRNYLAKVKINKVLDSQKAKIETLLLNILPASVAKELERNGHARPRFYDSVSVLFTDFKDFTKIADGMTPREIVDELNDFFSAFDDIIEKHHLEKIKTIGDAYMCAGGIPVEDTVHPVNIVRAALEIVNYMSMKNAIREKEGKNPWNLRVGIHTGPIAAGVVGKRKYAYDIWGSTVNIASRMESNGSPGKVNISAATFELVKDKFECHYRGKISAKNVGEVDMYFVEREILHENPVAETVA